MTAETDLLPLPNADLRAVPRIHPAYYDRETLEAYARANLAELQREVEGLRAEVAEAEKVLRGALDASTDGEPLRVLAIRASNALYWRTERAERAEARAERLAGALRVQAETWESEGIRLNGGADKPYSDDVNSIRAFVLGCCSYELKTILHDAARAALDQETTNG